MQEQNPPTKAERAAAARAASKAAAEAQALRANLLRRKAQARALQPGPAAPTQEPKEGPETCR
jgi:hypothetical protein